MRLALVASLLPADSAGGAEAYVHASARSLSRRHDVVLLTGSRAGDVDGVEVVRLPRLPMLGSAAPLPGRVLWHALDQWLPHVHLLLVRELRRVAPDLVATHNAQGLSAAVFTAVAATRLPHVHTAHDLNLLCARVTMTRDGEYCGGRCAACRVQRALRGGALRRNLAKLIGVSRYVCDRHVEQGVVPAAKAEAIRLGADPGRARLRRVSEGRVRLGFLGTLGAHKGIRTLIEALGRAPEAWTLVVAGSGPLEREVAAAAARDPRVEFLGHVAGDAKDEFFDQLDLVVIPSEWEEPATFVAVEAAIRGIPAVVSDRGGLPEVPHARLFRSGDPDALVEAIRWFVAEPTRLETASARLLGAGDEFRWETHVSRVAAVLESAAA